MPIEDSGRRDRLNPEQSPAGNRKIVGNKKEKNLRDLYDVMNFYTADPFTIRKRRVLDPPKTIYTGSLLL